MTHSFWRARGGNFGMMTAVLLPTLLAGVGLALDTANIVNAKSRLQSAADAAVLAASRENATDEEREVLFASFVNSQFGTSGEVDIRGTDLVANEGLNYVELTGSINARINLYLMNRFGAEDIEISATSFRSTKTLEIAMALDNTGSMGSGGINALKKASKALLTAVESGGDQRQDVRVALIPFVTAVNVKGEGFDPAWIDTTGQSLYNGWNFIEDPLRTRRELQGERLSDLPQSAVDNIMAGWKGGGGQACKNNGNGDPAEEKRARCDAVKVYPHHTRLFELSGTTWKGCVEARPVPYNSDLTPPDPARPETLFVPYFAPDEPGVTMTNGGNEGGKFNNSWLEDDTSYEHVSANFAKIQRHPGRYMHPETKTVKEAPNLTLGPNRACPTPIVPLTDDLAKVRAGIDAMQYWNGSGTNIAEGLAWGWRVLSPEAPYTQGSAFNAPNVSKFMVLMTDGTNVSFGASGEAINKSDYGSYGFLQTGRINNKVKQNEAESVLNGWTGSMCTQMKNQGVTIYTVLYNTTAASVQTMLRNCASKPENYHLANNTAALEKAFADIGRSVAALHLTH